MEEDIRKFGVRVAQFHFHTMKVQREAVAAVPAVSVESSASAGCETFSSEALQNRQNRVQETWTRAKRAGPAESDRAGALMATIGSGRVDCVAQLCGARTLVAQFRLLAALGLVLQTK